MSTLVNKILSIERITTYPEACKNYHHPKIVCDSCVQACEKNAISLEDSIPVIEEKSCVDCGACVSICSVLAIDHLHFPYKKIKKQLAANPKALITCTRVEEMNRGIKIPCLLYLDLTLLTIVLGKREKLDFYIGHCKNCDKAAEDKITQHLENLLRRLEQLGITIPILLTEVLPNETEVETVDAVSRRDLFKKFSFNHLRELVIPTQEEEVIPIYNRLLTKKRTLLEYAENVNLANSNYFFQFQVTEECNGCPVCARVCPTDALFWNWSEEKMTTQLIFDSVLCIGCEKCLVCPTKALTKVPITNEYLLIQKELMTMHLVTCSICEETFKASNNQKICYVCAAKSLKDPMRFFQS